MKPVDQLQMRDTERGLRGDCFRACIASLLEMKAEDVPHFVEIAETEPKQWWGDVLGKWLAPMDLCYIDLPIRDGGNFKYLEPYEAGQVLLDWFPTYGVLSGMGPRGFRHCCIGKGFDIIHDPHPSRAGLLTLDTFGIMVRRFN